ncbi:MAG: NIPSNAP family protein [Pseudomonadota bacterium]
MELHPPPAIVELRQYTLHPGRRDALIALFDREFIETQEAVGMTVLGQFRDLGDPDRFVWLRGFASMPARALALAAFYDGPVWRAHRAAANATMIDSDNVLLLRPVVDAAMPIDAWARDAGGPRAAAVLAIVAARDQDPGFAPVIAQAGGELVARYETEPGANTFPGLPVREGESVAVWLARFADVRTCTQVADALAHGPLAPMQLLLLAPTPRSRF